MTNLLDVALSLHAAGLCVLPACPATKRPTLARWNPYRDKRPSEDELRAWFGEATALCILTGKASGNLEVLDFDCAGERFAAWSQLIQEHCPDLWNKLVVERTPSGGYHVPFQIGATVPGNTKLAERIVEAPDANEMVLYGKKYKPRQHNGRWIVTLVLIETRGEGGLVLCAPSPGYSMLQGSLEDLPILSTEDRSILIDAAKSLNEVTPQPESVSLPQSANEGRPGDDFNLRGDVRALLIKHGWTLAKPGENEYWRRPGKTDGWSATLKNGVLYVFSSNAAPFLPEKAYAPFSVYTLLEHNGDYAKAASALRSSGYGIDPTEQGVNLSAFLTPKPDLATLEYLTPKALFNYDTSDDPNTLLGERWLCRGGACLLVGQTGIGKSSFSMQAAISWALGQPLFGITPRKPLKSLIIQAENDVGDLAEMFGGVINGIDLVDHLDDLDPQMVFITETARSGSAFHPYARALIDRHKPDLVWIDPLFAFIGGSISDQESVSPFLRNGLGAISQETGVAWIIVHHTNKPPRDPALRSGFVSGDYAYLGAGSAELANWARAVLTLREVEDSLYELRASKRGRRAGLVDANGEFATEVFLQHGSRGICWERSVAPENDLAEVDAAYAQEVIETMTPGESYGRNQVRDLVAKALGVKSHSVLTPGRRAKRVFQSVLDQTRQSLQPGYFMRSDNVQTVSSGSSKGSEDDEDGGHDE